MRIHLFILCTACASFAHTQPGDPLRSPECAAAREVLEHALDAAAAKKAGAGVQLAKARREAIEACLGRDDEPRERSGAPDPSIAVSPPATGPVIPPVVIAAPTALPRPPTAVTACDPGGCWDSEGRRLNSVGPLLVGPRGACTVQGGVVHCP